MKKRPSTHSPSHQSPIAHQLRASGRDAPRTPARPFAGINQTIALFGGTFDPPHLGHLLVAERALKQAKLDQIWWIPARGNPLKSRQPAPISERLSAIHALTSHPKMRAYDLETELDTRYTIDSVRAIKARFPKLKFVFIGGADLASELHHWRDWHALVKSIPMLFFARPSDQIRAGLSPFAKCYGQARFSERAAALVARAQAPAWALVSGKMHNISSSEIRAKNER